MKVSSIFNDCIKETRQQTFNWYNDTKLIKECDYENVIVDKIRDLFNYYTRKHSKVIVIRFDVHYPKGYYPPAGDIDAPIGNTDLSTCMAYVIKKYKRQKLDPYYIWVREQKRSIHPHYHCALLLDGQKIKSFSHVFDTVQDEWERVIGQQAHGCINHCTSEIDKDYNGKMIRRCDEQSRYLHRCHEVFQQLSYLAKSLTKAHANDGLRNFGISRIPKLYKGIPYE